jgi:hypothetical protein
MGSKKDRDWRVLSKKTSLNAIPYHRLLGKLKKNKKR